MLGSCAYRVCARAFRDGSERCIRREEGGCEGVRKPKLCVPKMAQINFSFCTSLRGYFAFCHRKIWLQGSGAGGGGGIQERPQKVRCGPAAVLQSSRARLHTAFIASSVPVVCDWPWNVPKAHCAAPYPRRHEATDTCVPNAPVSQATVTAHHCPAALQHFQTSIQGEDPNQHSPGTPTTGLRERGNDTSRSTGRSGRQNAATRRNMRRDERVTVQGPVKRQQPDGVSHRGGGGAPPMVVCHSDKPLNGPE